MDSSEATHVSLCAGYGGIDLGLRRCINLRTVAYAEIEAFAVELLLARMESGSLDAAPIWTDLKSFPWAAFRGKVDILSGGYPCQPFSSAGKRLGAEDPRHLWPYIADGIAVMRPRVCFFENVEGHITLGLRDVLHDLAGMGYRTTWCVASASEVGAPHQRKRVFILAYDTSLGIQGRWTSWLQEPRSHAGQALPVRGGDAGGTWPARPGDMGNAKHNGLHGAEVARGHEANAGTRASQKPQMVEQCDGAGCVAGTLWPSRPGEPQHEWEPPRVVGNTGSKRCEQDPALRSRQQAGGIGEECGVGVAEAMGDADHGRQPSGIDTGGCPEAYGGGQGDVEQAEPGQAQPPLGRDADGAAGGVGDAELFESCDNRTDELRLLGNGVVPQTAERAWRVLIDDLKNDGVQT